MRVVEDGVETIEERLDAANGVIQLADDATVLGELHIADPNLPTGVSVVVRFPVAGAAPDPGQIEAALGDRARLPQRRRSDHVAPDDAAEIARRTVSLGKVLRVLPLPGRTPETLASLEPGDTLPTVGRRGAVRRQRVHPAVQRADEDAGRRREHLRDDARRTSRPHRRHAGAGIAQMPSATRIIDRLPSLYRPEVDAAGLFTAFVRAVGSRLDGVSRESSDVMQAHWFSSADSALFSEFVRRTPRADRRPAGAPHRRDRRGAALSDRSAAPRRRCSIARPWLDPPLSRDRVEDFRRRLADVVTMYRHGLGTLAALRLATRIALPVSDREAPPGLRTRSFTVEEFAPLRVTTQAIQARGQPLDMVGPLMQWAVDQRLAPSGASHCVHRRRHAGGRAGRCDRAPGAGAGARERQHRDRPRIRGHACAVAGAGVVARVPVVAGHRERCRRGDVVGRRGVERESCRSGTVGRRRRRARRERWSRSSSPPITSSGRPPTTRAKGKLWRTDGSDVAGGAERTAGDSLSRRTRQPSADRTRHRRDSAGALCARRHAVTGSRDARGPGGTRARTRCGGALVGRHERRRRAGRQRSDADAWSGRARARPRSRRSMLCSSMPTAPCSSAASSACFSSRRARNRWFHYGGAAVDEVEPGLDSVRSGRRRASRRRHGVHAAGAQRAARARCGVVARHRERHRAVSRPRASPHVHDAARGVPGGHPGAGAHALPRTSAASCGSRPTPA